MQQVIRCHWLLIFVTGLVFGGFMLHGNVGFNIADEGFLWDGVRRTASGDMPIRDFNAYDPGRYYWCAAGTHFLGDGLLGLRISTSIFRIIGLFFGLLAARRVVRSLPGLLAVALFLWWWNPTFYKTFEATFASAAVYFGVRLIESPRPRTHFIAGLVAGIAAIFGRNLGLYMAVAHAGIIGFLQLKHIAIAPLPRRLASWVAGIVVGYSPLLLMLALIPGFAESFSESVAFHFHLGQTNLPLPVPWPWTASATGSRMEFVVALAVGMGFLLLLMFCVGGAIAILFVPRDRVRDMALFIASVFTAIAFAHHAFARADYEHLAHAIPPLLLGLVAALALLIRPAGYVTRVAPSVRYASAIVGVAVLAGTTFLATLPYNFPAQWYGRRGPRWQYVPYSVAGDTLRLPMWQVDAIRMFEAALLRHSQPGAPFVIAPYEAGFYPVFGQASPLWNAYFVYPELESRQARMVQQLQAKGVRLALINDAACVDGNTVYRFRNSHPLLWRHLNDTFRVVPDDALPPGWIVFVKD